MEELLKVVSPGRKPADVKTVVDPNTISYHRLRLHFHNLGEGYVKELLMMLGEHALRAYGRGHRDFVEILEAYGYMSPSAHTVSTELRKAIQTMLPTGPLFDAVNAVKESNIR
jgi:hypothetical protein